MDDSLWKSNWWRGAGLGRIIGGLLLSAVCLTLPASLQALPIEEIYSFARLPSSHSELVEGVDGAFYGTTYGGGSGGLGTVYRVTPAGVMTTLVEFNSRNGADPVGDFVSGADGVLYGATASGGRGGGGTLFRVDTNGVLATLVEFYGTNGASPNGSLVQGHDGAFYGVTQSGGESGCGTVFRVTTKGKLTTLGSFYWTDRSSGYYPGGHLLEGRDGAFYGVTQSGGESGCGTVFRVNTNGGLTTLASFNTTNSYHLPGTLIEGSDGAFYGTSYWLGDTNLNTVFRVSTNGELTTLASFSSTNNYYYPAGALIEGSDGAFYGTTAGGGDWGWGTVFRVTTNGVVTLLASFDGETNGAFPQGRLMRGPAGQIYGVAYWTIFSLSTNGEFSVLSSLDSQTAGSGFSAGLILARDGALYGTTETEGNHNYGAVFRCTLKGEVTVLAPFQHTEGGEARSGLVLGRDGAFYGTTALGGSNNWGTIFRLTQAGQLTILFHCRLESGANPHDGVIEGHDGAFYGLSERGPGAVFRVTTNGELTTLAGFGATNGWWPSGKLVQGHDGALYGVTKYAQYDLPDQFWGNGTVFRVTTNGELTTLVFFNHTNGANPNGSLIQALDGAFYGTTSEGGRYGNGTVFRVTPSGELTTLIAFDYTNGASPLAGLVQDANGMLYGTTSHGGTNGSGTVFSLSTNGIFATLVSFDGYPQGGYPSAGLVPGPDGALYGKTDTTFFRMTTNGVFKSLGPANTMNLMGSEGGLVFDSDGALYGLVPWGGTRGGGGVFRVFLAPRLQAPIPWYYSNSRFIYFSGIPGDTYNLLRAADLSGPWELLGSITANQDGNGHYIDYGVPRDKAFYRLVGP